MSLTYSRYVPQLHSLTLTLSVTILSHEIERTPGKTGGISYAIWKPNTFQVFSCAGFSSVFLSRCVERVREVVGDHGQQSGKKRRVLRYVLTQDVRGNTFKNLIKVRQRSVGVRCDQAILRSRRPSVS